MPKMSSISSAVYLQCRLLTEIGWFEVVRGQLIQGQWKQRHSIERTIINNISVLLVSYLSPFLGYWSKIADCNLPHLLFGAPLG